MVESIAKAIVSSPNHTPDWMLCARLALGLMAVQTGGEKSAAEQYAALSLFRTGDDHFQLDRLLGLLTQTMGQCEEAARHFEAALAFCRGGYRPWLAWTCYEYAALLLERVAVGDIERARSLLDEGHALAKQLGMRPLLERIEKL